MADVNANIDINIDSSNALAQLKALQRQISQFHTSIAKSSEAAALAQKGLQKNLLNSINAIGAFTAEMRTVRTSAESFTDSLEKNKFSMREYFRYAGASTKTFGRLFKSEFDTIGKVAEERVKRLQTQYIKMGRDTNGAMRAMAIMPTQLDMSDYTTKVQIAAQKQALFNQLMKQGSTNLLNFGKNTQWAGRQLMVGFTLPLMAVGTAATKAFMDMEAQALRFRKVYGDLFTPKGETQRALEDITELGKQFTKYGVAVSTTVGLAAEAAAAGFQGLDLQRQTTEATRLSILGQVDSQKALETTISLQNAFGMSSENLADSINFLNAVENQTVVSLDDITTAIPKVAPVIQQLGGDVKDLTFFIAAMKEGGINASEGANALKSGLAALINPTKKASDMLASFGINATAIVEKNKGDLKATVIGFANALNTLDPLSRARAIEQMFGKFQFARLSTLFANVARDGNQAARVLDLANASVEELSALSEQELGMTAESSMNKFKKSVEDLKVALIPVGQAFLEAATPIVEFVGNILEKFANLSDGTKRLITLLTVGIGAVGPVLLMTFGLLANGIANIIKLFLTLRGGYQRLTGQTSILGEQTQYMTMEQLDAAAAAHSLNQTHATLTQTFTAERTAINQLISAYNSAAGAARNFAMNNPGMMMPGKGLKKFAQGGIISGPGGPTSDSVPVMASDGEAIISAKTVKKYPGIIDGLISGNIPGFKRTGVVGRTAAFRLQDSYELGHFAPAMQMTGAELQEFAKTQSQSVKITIDKLINSVQNGLEHAFDVFTNEVVVQSTELNQALDEVGSGKTAPKSLFKEEAVAGAGAYNAPLLAKMKEAGASPEELKIAVTQLAKEFDEGIKDLGDQTTVTAEEVNRITQKAYDTVSKTNKQVKAAREKMKKPGVLKEQFGEIKTGGRTAFSGAYSTRTNRKRVNEIVQQNLPGRFPTQQGAKFTLEAAQDVGIKGAQEIREIFRKLDNEAKKRVELLVGDVRAMSKQVIAEAEKAGIDIGKYTIQGISTGVKTASPSKETEKIGKEIARGLEVGMQSRQDDVALAGANLGKAATGGVKGAVPPVIFQSAGQPGSVAANAPRPGVPMSVLNAAYEENAMRDLVRTQQKRMAVANQRMNSLNKAFMSGTFALSALSGVASMAGGNLGKFSQILFTLTGPLFALSSILQMLTGSPILKLIANFGKVKFGLVSVGIAALVTGFTLYRKSQEETRRKLLLFKDALTITEKQAKSTAEYFGITRKKSALETGARGIEATATIPTFRDKVNEFIESDTFKNNYESAIKSLSEQTDNAARTALLLRAQSLLAEGYSEEQINIIISALQQKAGKQKLNLFFKDIEIDALNKNVMDGLKEQLADLGKFAGGKGFRDQVTEKFNESTGNFDLFIKKIPTKEFQAAIDNAGAGINSFLKSVALLREQGKLSIGDVEKAYNSLMYTVNTTTPNSQIKVALLNAALKDLKDPVAIAATQTEDLAKKAKLLEAAMFGAVIPTALLNEYLNPDSGNPNLYAQGQTEARINALIKAAKEATKLVNDIVTGGTGGKTGGKKEPNVLQKMINEMTEQTKVFDILIKKRVEYKQALELSNNAEVRTFILGAKNNTQMKERIALINKLNIATKAQAAAELKALPADEKKLIELDYLKKQVELREAIIDAQFAPQIKKENDALDAQEKKLAGINKQIEDVRRKQIEPIQNLIDSNNYALQVIALQEDAINEKYNKEIEALDKIEKANQNIANIQKQRMSIADALTRGDISTAAQAVQEARAERAQSALTGQRDILTRARDEKIEALGRVQLEKQNKELQLQIATIEKDQLKTLELQKTTIEDTIAGHTANITALNTQVAQLKDTYKYGAYTKSEIESLEGLILKAQAAGVKFTDELIKQAEAAERLAAALANRKPTGTEVLSGIASGTITKNTITFDQAMAGAKQATANIKEFLAKNIKPQKKMYGGAILPQSKGGMGIVKTMAFGGRAIGSDTVPAMLTPGEFVVNKAASKAYGPLLERINESKYPSMLGRGGMTQIPVNNITTSMNDNSTAVYNYNLGFSINGANGNANDIARAVMREIKNVDSQRIRGQRR